MMPEIDSNDIIEDILSIEKLKPISDITSKVSTILDVGGGSGRIWNLSGVEKDIALLDIDLSNTEIKNPYSHLIAESAERAHFFSGEYDLVTMMGLLEYLDDPRKVLLIKNILIYCQICFVFTDGSKNHLHFTKFVRQPLAVFNQFLVLLFKSNILTQLFRTKI